LPAIVDTSALVGLALSRDPRHADIAAAIAAEPGSLTVPLTVVVETAQLIGRRLGAASESAWLRALIAGTWVIESPGVSDLERAAQLIDQYHEADIGLVDATIVAIAERLGSTRLYTLDRRDFSLLRPRHIAAFELLP
jgi:predicted nucleic acid-binding protein